MSCHNPIVAGMSNGLFIMLVEEHQWDFLFTIRSLPDGGTKHSRRGNLVEGGEVEQAVGFRPLGLTEHIRQTPLASGDDQPASATVAESFLVRLTFEVGETGQDFLAIKAGIILRTAIYFQQVADAVFAGIEHKVPIGTDIPCHLFVLIRVGDFVWVRPEFALRYPGFEFDLGIFLAGLHQVEAEVINC